MLKKCVYSYFKLVFICMTDFKMKSRESLLRAQVLVLVLVLLIVLPKAVRSEFENQAKIQTHSGNLILEAARDKNITIRVNGDSCFLVNNVNILEVIRKKIKPAGTTDGAEGDVDEEQSLPAQVATLKNDLRRLTNRLQRVENRTRNAIPNGRIRRLLARLRTVGQRVTDIETKLSENNCEQSPCQHGGTCYNLYDNFHCECTAGWSGKTCDQDIDECYQLAGTDLGCQNNAVCVNLPGSYRCTCTNGFVGTHCRERSTDCGKSLPGELCGNGVCVPANTPLGYTCICNQGWKSNNDNDTPACTIDVDECEDAHNTCHATCINLPGTFTCGSCPSGYTGNGITCIDIDECAFNNGGCSTMPRVQCINTEGSHHCGNCPPGWFGDGRFCSQADTNSCASQNVCHPLAKCEYISNTIICTCPAGMAGMGFGPNGCAAGELTSLCSGNQCQNGATCITNGRSYTCVCPSGFVGNLCQNEDPCRPNQCRNGGTCHKLPAGRFRCICPRGAYGQFCEVLRNTCGSVIRQVTGELSYPPTGSSNYLSNERCAWIIKTNESKILNLTFTQFDVENAAECGKDWLQLHDGRSLASQLIGRFCGNELPLGGNILTSHNQVFLWFRSDNTTNGGGFHLTWNSTDPICGGNMLLEEKDHGVIKSPGYPGKSPANRDCEWVLTAPYGQRILMHFYEVNLDASPNCTKDTLKIYDSGELLEALCDSAIPDSKHTSSPMARIHFHTDSFRADSSFQLHYEVVPGDPNCGGHYTAASGTFTGNMQSNVCLYLIQQPPGTKILLEFTRFSLIQSYDCHLQKIEIYDGRSDEDPLIGRWCGGTTPKSITSKNHFLLLRHEVFLAGFALLRVFGFEAKYSRVCGDDFRELDGGVFTTPNYPNAYYEEITCTYNILGPVNSIVHLNITDYSISEYEDATDCNDDVDYIEIFYKLHGPGDRHCKDTPMHIVSQDNRLRIVFHSGMNPAKARGIRAEYSFETISCGGVLTDMQGSFTKYDVTTDKSIAPYCQWILEAPENHVISLNLLYTRSGAKCMPGDSDLSIYTNGSASGSELIGSYCDEEKSISNVFHTNLMTIFVKKVPEEQKGQLTYGIAVNYTFIESTTTCGGNYSYRYGSLQSPGWPNEYPDETDCVWVIHAPLGHKIELLPTNFTLETTERYTSADDCRDDYLEIRNGMTEQSPLIGKFCGTRIPARIPSFTNHLYLHFHSDMLIPAAGFSINWEQTTTGCGGHLDSYRGSIHSPHYPEVANGPVQCDWKITVSEGSTIVVHITKVTPTSDFCSNNVLTLYDGPSPASKQLPLNCSAISRSSSGGSSNVITVKSSRNTVYVRYSLEDGTEEDQQFMLDYETNCRNRIDARQGIIESPNFPDDYPPELNCEWDIQGRKDDKISLTFSHLELELISLSCPYDYLELVDMKGEEILQNHRICTDPPDLLITDGNRLLVKFFTDISASAPGFRLEFRREGCGGHLIKSSGLLGSPNIPYSVDADCEWFIETDPGWLIILDVFELHIETEKLDCAANALLVSNERNDTKYLLQECKVESQTVTVTSHGNTMFVRFKTDAVRSRKYFKASYRTKESACGGIYRGNSGEITSPNYPNAYPVNSYCDWLISVEHSFNFELTFDFFDLPNTTNCDDASLEVYEGIKSDDNSQLLLRHCGSAVPLPPAVRTRSGNQINVIFNAGNTARVGKGFAMRYKKICGGRIADSASGIIKSYPDESCNWLISGKDGSHVTLSFLHVECSCFGGINSNGCRSGIWVYGSDATKSGTQLIAHVCNSHPSTITSSGSTLSVISRNVTFRAQYSTFENACGGSFTSLRGSFASPLYPNTYPSNVECIWTIDGEPGNYLELNFDVMDIAKSNDCNDDYLEIRENSPAGKLLGLFCSDELPASSLIAYEKFWIKFYSGEGQVGNGFKATWTYAHENEISGALGVIAPPPTASIVEDSDPFKWRVTVPRGHLILLNFKEYNEGLSLYDGFDEVSLKVEIQHSPWIFTSSTNVIFLQSDNQQLERFRIEWSAISKDAIASNQTISDCQDVIVLPYDSHVNLSSPGYPYGYNRSLSCRWTVTTEDSTQHAVLLLYEARLEEMDGCLADSLKISSSKNLADWREELTICKSPPMSYEPIAIIHGTPNLKLEFASDFSVNGSGFTSDLVTQCGSYLTGTVGTILDRNVLNSRAYNQTCLWHIEVRPGRKIQFTLEFPLSMNPRPEFCDNYAIIYDGIDEWAPILKPGQICSRLNERLLTTSNRATVQYKLKWSNRLNVKDDMQQLWNLTYREYSECGGEIRLTRLAPSVNISSPRYPNVPHPHTECVWIILAPPGESVQVQFVERFDMNVRRCNQEFVEFRDGSTALARSIGHYCTKPGTVRSSGNVMYMRYLTDISEPRNGFMANISISTCGGTFTALSGEITSVHYPALGAYPSQSVCEYIIKVASYSRISLSLIDLDLPYDSTNSNSSDHLKIYIITQSESFRAETELATFYGNGTLASQMTSFEVDSNEVLIRFHTYRPNNRFRGFKLKYERIYGLCFKEVSGESGILTLNTPLRGLMFLLCRWKITVPKGRRVKLEILNANGPVPNDNSTSVTKKFTVALFNDFDMQSRITTLNLTSYSPSDIVLSSDNTMFVRIIGGYTISPRQLQARYSSSEPSDCPANIGSSQSGSLSTNALATSGYRAENFYCKSEFVLSGRETISFLVRQLVTSAPVSTNRPDRLNGIRFRNSDLVESYEVLSTNLTNAVVAMTGKRGSVSIVQNEALQIIQFDGSYKRHPCGGVYSLTQDLVIESPNFSGVNYESLDCVWLLNRNGMAENGFDLSVNFSLSLPCEQEYISIYGGPTANYEEIVRICRGSPAFNTTHITKQYTTIVYHTDKYTFGQSSFRIATIMATNCGGNIMIDRSWTIQFDKNAYKNNIECIWDLKASSGFYIELQFQGRFFIESSPNCTKDYLEIRRGQKGEWTNLPRLCGRDLPVAINTTSNRIQVIFRSDANMTGDGFILVARKTCSATFNVTQEIQKIFYPVAWTMTRPKIHCEFTLQSDSDKFINVRFNRGQWGKRERCLVSRFTVFRKNDADAIVESGEYCRDNMLSDVRARKFIRLVYDARLEVLGGSEIEFSLDSCGGPVTRPTQIRHLQSESADTYAGDMHCVWNVTAPEGHAIVVQFKYLDMESNWKCKFDYLAIYAGPDAREDRRIVRMCGNLTVNPPTVAVDTNRAVIVAVSDQYMSAGGFLASILFTRNCNERITLTTGNTPVRILRDFNVSASEVMICHYSFMAPVGYRVQIEVKQLNINTPANRICFEADDECGRCNYVELFDSERSGRTSLGRFCSEVPPALTKLLSSFEDFTMKTSATIPGQYHFEIELQVVKSICGGRSQMVLTGDEPLNIIFPPDGIDGNYPPNAHCYWLITSKRDFQMEFNSFALQDVSDVTGKCVDYVSVQYNQLTKEFCGNVSSFKLSIQRDTDAVVTFHSNEAIESKGFNVSFVNTRFCNRTLTDNSGSIYRHSGTGKCYDDIIVPDDYTIAMYIQSLYFKESNCSINYIKIVDKHTNETLYKRCEDLYETIVIPLPSNKIQIQTEAASVGLFYVATKKPNTPGCGGEIHASEGQFTNPPYNDDRNQSDCRWDIIMPAPNRIRMFFFDFNMGSPVNCLLDYMKILEVSTDGTEKMVRNYCGQDTPEMFISEGSHIAIISKKSPNFDGTGWSISYESYAPIGVMGRIMQPGE